MDNPFESAIDTQIDLVTSKDKVIRNLSSITSNDLWGWDSYKHLSLAESWKLNAPLARLFRDIVTPVLHLQDLVGRRSQGATWPGAWVDTIKRNI